MTSKNSFFKILKLCFKERLWGIAASCLLFFFSFPVYGALNAAAIRETIEYSIALKGMGGQLYANSVLGEMNVMARIAVILIAIVLAFNCFGYLYSKSKVDMYLSLPVKRENYFAARYVSGFVTFLAPYIVFLLAAAAVGGANGMLVWGGVKSALIMLGINVLGFLGTYNITIIAIYLTGNPVVGLLGTGVLLFYGDIVQIIITGYMSSCYGTYSNYSANCQPAAGFISGYIKLTEDMHSFAGTYDINAARVMIYILAVVISLVIAVMLCKLRAAEAASRSMAFPITMPVISVLLLIPASLAGGITFATFTGNGIKDNPGWYVFGFAIALILGHFVIQAIYYLDFKSIFANLYNPLTAGIIGAAAAAVFIFDITGYDNYIPADNAYESAAVASYSMQGNIEYFDYDASVNEYGGIDINVDQVEYRLDNIKITDKELVRDFMAAAIEDSKALKEYYDSVGDNEEYYEKATSYADIVVKYNKSGDRYVYRNYHINLTEHMDLYSRLYANEEYKEVVCPMLTIDPASADNICYSDLFGTAQVTFSDEDMVRLVKAYQKDVMAQDAYSLKNELPYGYIYRNVSFSLPDGYAQTCYDKKAYVYPSFTNTVAVLKEYDINLNYYKDLTNIASISICDYNNTDESGEPFTIEYTETSDIEKIIDYIYPYESLSVEGIIRTEGPDVSVLFKEAPQNFSYGCGYGFLKGEVPEFISAAVSGY